MCKIHLLPDDFKIRRSVKLFSDDSTIMETKEIFALKRAVNRIHFDDSIRLDFS